MRHGKDFRCISRLDRPAIQNFRLIKTRLIKPTPDAKVHLGDLNRRCHLAGADGPDRLIGDGQCRCWKR